MNKEGEELDYLGKKFPSISEAKVKEVIFVGPRGKQRFQDLDFKNKLNAVDNRAWDAFEYICSNFWGGGNKKTTQKS